MLTPEQLARRVAKEGEVPGTVVIEAERVSAEGDVVCDDEALSAAGGAQRVVAVMDHLDGEGRPRLVTSCGGAASARGMVQRVVTPLGVIDITREGLIVREVAPGISAREVQAKTEPPLLAGPDLAAVEG